ncbi:hypothetical protein [Flexivirga oryzae]|uniref:Uncharacterized protein n=1 Tax=Flexivirga oryzae TaxID=1794944 RepID=A0A839NCU4_9MICO|nr:hypothetical protein [Flexivirga oryzae]MBB2893005.1 hypothetical protein [Flexivirga oryzae]
MQQLERGSAASDIIAISRLSPIDRRVITHAVKEIRATQERMASTAGSLGIDQWRTPTER